MSDGGIPGEWAYVKWSTNISWAVDEGSGIAGKNAGLEISYLLIVC